MIAILIPMLGRPHRVQPVLQSVEEATPEPHRVVFICSPGDTEVHRAIDELGAQRLTVSRQPGPGDYATKINHGYRETTEPYLFLGADDLRFHPGWLPAALRYAGTGVIGTQDLGNSRVLAGNHSTHSVVSRYYADEFGTIDQPGLILHEGYWHEYVDDELVGTAKARGEWAFAADSIVEHLHPTWGKADNDEMYAMQKVRMHRSRPLFEQRRKMWERHSG